MRGAGLAPKRRRRCNQRRKRRERMPQRGHMIIWDGSPHRWFGKDNPPCCLMSSVDAAAGEILAAFFIEAEGSIAYLLLLYEILVELGRILEELGVQICRGKISSSKRKDGKILWNPPR